MSEAPPKPPRRTGPPPKVSDQEFLAMVRQGLMSHEIAAKAGYKSAYSVDGRLARLRQRGVEIPSRADNIGKTNRGRQNPRAGGLKSRLRDKAAALAGKMSDRKAARLAGVHHHTIMAMRLERGLAPVGRAGPRHPPEAIIALVREGKTDRQIAEQLGYSTEYVSGRISRLRRAGVPVPYRDQYVVQEPRRRAKLR